LREGGVKATFGTGCFALAVGGDSPVIPDNRLLGTVACKIGNAATFAVEGSVFIAGAAVQWLRDELGIIADASQTAELAASLPDNRGVYLVPAFTGLGAPHWRADARGAMFGLTRDSGKAVFARAALEAVCYQAADLLAAMASAGVRPAALRVDGGMAASDWTMANLADIAGVAVARPQVVETTAVGAAFLAGLQAGVFSSADEMENLWQQDAEFSPRIDDAEREARLNGWRRAVAATLSFADSDRR
jgi:glycerol kinase